MILSDVENFLIYLEGICRANGLKTIKVDSSTEKDENIAAFFNETNSFLEKTDIDVLLCSDVIDGMEISIENYFSKQYCFFFGTKRVMTAAGMITSLLDKNIPCYIWAAESAELEYLEFKIFLLDEGFSTCINLLSLDLGLTIDPEVFSPLIVKEAQTYLKETKENFLESLDAIKSSIPTLTNTVQKMGQEAEYERLHFRKLLSRSLERKGFSFQ